MEILVSIIVPNYNHFLFLQKRLDSIFNQTFQNFEVIILDDASTDESLELLNKIKNHQKVSHFIINKLNSGSPFIQWKKGLALAKGKYIWIAESDDSCELTFLEKTVKILEENREVSLVFTNSVLQNLLSSKSNTLTSSQSTGIYNSTENKFLYNWFFNHSNFRIANASSCVFRLSYISEDMIMQISNYRYAGDKLFWSSLLVRFPNFGYISEPLNIHTFHKNTTRSIVTKQTNYIRNKEVLSIYDFCDFSTISNYSAGWQREYGSRLLLSFLFNLLLFKKFKGKDLYNGLKIVKFNFEVWKKIYRAILLPNR